MLIVDDILLFPMRSIFFIFRETCNAAQQESLNEAEAIRTELSELYMMLETGAITEDQFDAEEEELLDRLDALEAPDTEMPHEHATLG